MPTIELVSLSCSRVPKIPRYRSFGWLADAKLDSHRTLFQSLFDEQRGVIFHLGNKEQEQNPNGYWFAGMVMDWEKAKTVFFPQDAFDEFQDLLSRLLRASPEKRVIFSTDYQFGGRRAVFGEIRLKTFLTMHATQK